MNRVTTEIPETYNNFTRPITIGIVRDIVERFNLPDGDTVQFIGSGGAIAQSGSTLAKNNTDPLFPFRGKVVVEIDENYIEDSVLHNDLKVRDQTPIFNDPDLGVSISPNYFRTETSISFTYSSKSRNEINTWRNKLRRKVKSGMESMLHEMLYHYSVPVAYTQILNEIYKRREAVAGYGSTYEEWLSQCFSPDLTLALNLDGTRALPVITEHQIRVQGWFDFTEVPDKPDKTEDGDLWTLTVTYTFNYDKPTTMSMYYPIMVHNQILNPKYLPMEKPYDLTEVESRFSVTGKLYDYFSVIGSSVGVYKGVRIPSIDTWEPMYQNKSHIPIITALLSIDLDNPTLLLNLTVLGTTELSPEILEYLKLRRDKITLVNNDVFLVELFRNGSPLGNESFYLDAELNLITHTELDLRDIHHVRISLLTNLLVLSKPSTESLLNNPLIAKRVIDTIELLSTPDRVDRIFSTLPEYSTVPNPSLPGLDVLPSAPDPYYDVLTEDINPTALSNALKVIGNRKITTTSYNEVVRRIKTNIDLSKVGQGRGLKTVMFSGIIARLD